MSDLTILEDNLLPIPLGKDELHRLAMNIIGKDLQKDNYEFLSINSSLEKIHSLYAQKINSFTLL